MGRNGTLLAAAAALIALLLPIASAGANPKCGGRRATVVGSGRDDVIKVPKHGPQVVVGLGGDDTIYAYRNKDRVCGGPGDDFLDGGTGRDKIYGGSGNDYVDAGPGSDKVFAGGGNDTVLGGPGGESVHGGPGADRLYGQLQDDDLYGEGDDDVLIGGQGIDSLHGGPGNEWIRGDTNRDRYFGDSGEDTLSFATATPPGPFPRMDGVLVNLRNNYAAGDDSKEKVYGIENLVGSRFDDELTGSGRGFVEGNGGDDQCEDFEKYDCGRVGAAAASEEAAPRVSVANVNSPDPGLVIHGVGGDESFQIRIASGGFMVDGPANELPDGGCTIASQSLGGIFCPAPSAQLGYVLTWGGGGDDHISIGPGFPRSAVIKLDGGGGSDLLEGSDGPDLLYAGESGRDHLIGRSGDDALVARNGDPDILDGGPGNDQLVTNDACGGHQFRGGPGKGDVGGFGHVDTTGVIAHLSGVARQKGAGNCSPTRISHDVEILEGTKFSDVLYGDGRNNPLITGREGNDRIFGMAGSDILRGDSGKDLIDGGGGKDQCDGGPGGARFQSC